MKKTIILLFALFFINILKNQAQSKIGATFGWNNSTTKTSNIFFGVNGFGEETNLIADSVSNELHYGLTLQAQLNPFFTVKIAPLLMQTRFVMLLSNDGDGFIPFRNDFLATYLSMPLLFQFRPLHKKINPYLQSGFAFNTLLQNRRRISEEKNPEKGILFEEKINIFQKFFEPQQTVLMAFGTGVDYTFKKSSIGVEFNWWRKIKEIKGASDVFNTPNYFHLSLVYLYNLSEK
jgi:hypothetical protein